MRPTLYAVVVVLVLLIAAALFVIPAQNRALTAPTSASGGLRTAVAPNYYVGLDISTEPVLPGYHDTLLYYVENNTNDAPISYLSNLTVLGTYYNTALKLLPFPGTPAKLAANVPIGSWAFQLPANTSTNGFDEPEFTVWANSTSMKMNTSDAINVEVGTLSIGASVCTVLDTCGSLTTGQPATVRVSARALDTFDDTSPLVNETVKVLFYSTGSAPVTVPGVPATLLTNGQGDAALTFTPLNTTFNVPGPNHVEIEVTDSVNASLTKFLNVTWHLYNPKGAANFAFYLNEQVYYSGQQVTAYWQTSGTNSTIGAINVTNYVVLDVSTDNVIASGLIESAADTGSFSFTLPTTYAGTFIVYAVVHNATEVWELDAESTAYFEIFSVIPSERSFNPGDTVTVAVTALGPALTGATITALVQASNSGQTLFSGNVTSGSFQFHIPTVAPADEYAIAVWASTATGGTVASSLQDISEASGFDLWAGVTSVSSYSDGSFAPGQTVQLSYTVTAYGTDQLPTVMEVVVYPGACGIFCSGNSPSIKSWFVTGSSGSVSFTIPSGTPNGLQEFIILADFPSGEALAPITVNVNSSPSVLNYELGAGSGLTVGWLILLVLLIVVALLIVAMMRRGKPGTMVMTPAASAPPAAEWKEPPSGGSGSSGSSGSPPSGT